MKALILLAAVSGGCATTWLATQATGTQGAWDEHVREEAVPLPGVIEHLTIELPLTVEHDQITEPGVNGAAATTHDGAARPFAMRCAIDQSAKNAVYHSAFRYGSRWGKQTAIAFLVEGALAAVLLGTATAAKPNGYFYGGFFALDAVLTGAIFFIPRKEIFRQDDVAVTTPIRSDCPDGLALDIGGQPYPIDAIGKLGEVGDQALDEWMAAPHCSGTRRRSSRHPGRRSRRWRRARASRPSPSARPGSWSSSASDRKSTRLNSSHYGLSRMPSSA